MEEGKDVNGILAFLRGGNDANITEVASVDPELLARCIAYVIDGRYHRQNTVKSIVKLLNKGSGIYRGVAWELIQKIPLSHLMELDSFWNEITNTKRLRHAVANKIANESRSQIFRAFFISPQSYRNLFARLYIPRTIFDNQEITNETYLLAYRLSNMSTIDAVKHFHLKKSDLLTKFGLPFHMVMDMIETPEKALELAEASDSKSFFEHIRWYKNIAGDDLYGQMAMKKLKQLKNPLDFLTKKEHLEASGALTPKLIGYLEERAFKIIEEMMKDFDIERMALIVDISSSMESAVEITKKLYEAFARSVNITDIISFNHIARVHSAEDLPSLKCDGWTSIGSAFVTLAQRIQARKGKDLPQVMILISDLEENRTPHLNPSLKLFKEYDIPLVILHCGYYRISPKIDYPHAKIVVQEFHDGLLMEIMRETAKLASKVAIKEKEITKVIRERKPIEEEIASIELPKRPKKSYRKGYLKEVLCP